MHRKQRIALLSPILSLCIACGSSDDPNPGEADGGAAGADAGEDQDQFVELVSRSWTIDPGTEPYRCTRKTISEDMYITKFRSMSPAGTHHTVLTFTPQPNAPDGDFNCAATINQNAMLFASGVGTDDFEFPDGVAMRIPAGSQLLLNLHLYNTTDAMMTGTSGTMVETVSPDDVEQEAEMIFGGSVTFGSVPVPASPGQTHTAEGSCTFSKAATVLNVWPHMHQLGTHMTVKNGTTVLHDRDFSFTEQTNWPIEPGYQVAAGSSLTVSCTWNNTTGKAVPFGDSSDKEMCFAGFYRYPATGASLYCVQ